MFLFSGFEIFEKWKFLENIFLVQRFMGSSWEIKIFSVFVIEEYIIIKSFCDNAEGLIFCVGISAASYSEKGPLEKFRKINIEGYIILKSFCDNIVYGIFLKPRLGVSYSEKGALLRGKMLLINIHINYK